MKNPNKAGVLILPAIAVLVSLFLGVLVAGCGEEGPLGNTPSKKPEWSK